MITKLEGDELAELFKERDDLQAKLQESMGLIEQITACKPLLEGMKLAFPKVQNHCETCVDIIAQLVESGESVIAEKQPDMHFAMLIGRAKQILVDGVTMEKSVAAQLEKLDSLWVVEPDQGGGE